MAKPKMELAAVRLVMLVFFVLIISFFLKAFYPEKLVLIVVGILGFGVLFVLISFVISKYLGV